MTDEISQPPALSTGGCMCGESATPLPKAARYRRLPLRPLPAQSGSAFSTVIFVHRSAVTITGETADTEDVGSSGLKVLRRYCLRCGSALFTVPDVTPDLMMVKAGGIDSTSGFTRCGNCSSGGAGPGSRPSQARRSLKAIRKSEEKRDELARERTGSTASQLEASSRAPIDAIVDRVRGAPKGVLKERPSVGGRPSAATMAARRSRALLEQLAPDQHAADFARAGADLVKFGVAQQAPERIVVGVAVSA